MKQVNKISLLVITTLLAACGTNNSSWTDTGKSKVIHDETKAVVPSVNLSKSEITRLEHEYLAFSTKALTINYMKDKLTFLIGADNGLANASKIIQELEYYRIKGESVAPFQALILAYPALYNILKGEPAVITKRNSPVSGPFDIFMSTPVDTPVALAATAIIATGFTANWNTVTGASSGYVVTVKQGTTTVASIPVTGQTSTSLVITSLTGSTAYTYTVQTNNGTGLSSPSNIISVSTTAAAIVEFKVNSNTNSQGKPLVAMDTAGDFVVVWDGIGTGDASGIFAQRYNAAGAVQGGEFRVNTYTTGEQISPSVAKDSAGDFIVTWQSRPVWPGVGQDGSYAGIYAQRYNAAGVAQPCNPGTGCNATTGEFRVNTTTAFDQQTPSVAMDTAGDFVISWGSSDGSNGGIYAQRYNAAGAPQGSEFQVNTSTTGDQGYPKVAMDTAGDFVVTWNNSPAGGVYEVAAQRYNAAGTPQGGEFQVNTFTTDRQQYPSVAMDSTGKFVISWQSFGQDGDRNGTYAQRYNAAGVVQPCQAGSGCNATTGEFKVNTYTPGWQGNPSVAMDTAGGFVISWNGSKQDGDGLYAYNIYAQRYNAAGAAQPCQAGTRCNATTGEFRINTITANMQIYPSIAMNSSGNFVVAWDNINAGGVWEIDALRYNASGVVQ